MAISPEEEFADDTAETEPVDGVIDLLDDGDEVLGFRPAKYHRHGAVELALLDRRVRGVLGFHHATRVGVHYLREAHERGVRAMCRRVGVINVGVELGGERLDERRLGFHVWVFFG